MGPRTYRDFRVATPLFIGFLILWSTFAMAESASDDDLVKLARKHFNYDFIKSQDEQKQLDTFFENVHVGKGTYLGPELEPEDVQKGYLWGPERTVKAEWIAWVCSDPVAVKMVQSAGIEIRGAKIDGEVELSWLKMEFPLSASYCYFTGDINLQGATIRDLGFCGSYLNSGMARNPSASRVLNAGDSKVKGNVNLAKASGDLIIFENAEIEGRLDCSDAKVEYYFTGNLMKVKGDVNFDFRAVGGIAITRSSIGGNLRCAVKTFIFHKDRKFHQIGSQIPRGLDASGARIDGDVTVKLDSSGGTGAWLEYTKIGLGLNLLPCNSPQRGNLDLQDASATGLSNNVKGWPNKKDLRLKGFVFSELGGDASLDPKVQIKWLRLQSPFVIQQYEQMATVFRNMGYEAASVEVSIAGKWDEGSETINKDQDTITYAGKHGQIGRLLFANLRLLFYDLIWFRGFGWLIGYGYRPWNALFISMSFVLVGWVVFKQAQMYYILTKKENVASKGKDRNFSPFIYSLETFVPLVKLGVAEHWNIEANTVPLKPLQFGPVKVLYPGVLVLWYYRIHIIAGWVFTSLWVAAFTGILKH